ncbi:MAG: DUF3592 domain-containing protein [Desulfuromonadales bacterium]|nr:DUF3592 domain-containing protein [Desulfuromonadales bacterium]
MTMRGGKGKKVKNGPLVIGKLMSVQETGTYVNYQEEFKLTFQFTTQDGQQITAKERRVISAVEGAQYQPGMEFPIRYNPKKPRDFMIDFKANENSITPAFEQSAGITEQAKNGPLVVGRVVSVKPTTDADMDGKKIYEVSIQFTTQAGRAVIAVSRQAVSPADLPRLQNPDMALPLRYDPNNPQDIMIDNHADPEEVRKAMNKYAVAAGLTTQEAVDIRDNGVQATGVVIQSKPSGNVVNGASEMVLTIRVTRPDNTGTYDVTTTKNVMQSAIPFTTPGSMVHVFYMPDNEQNVVVTFHA